MEDYSLSFTAASLMHYETEQIARVYLEYQDWKRVQKAVVEDNILQKGTISTRKREFAEIKKRLKDLSNEEMHFLTDATTDEIKLFTLVLCAKTYRLIYEFIAEVIREKYLMFDYTIYDSDYAKFIESKIASSPKLQSVTEKTLAKIKQVIFKILEQSTLIDSVKTKNIQKPYISKELEELVAKKDSKLLACYLYSKQEIKALKEDYNV